MGVREEQGRRWEVQLSRWKEGTRESSDGALGEAGRKGLGFWDREGITCEDR